MLLLLSCAEPVEIDLGLDDSGGGLGLSFTPAFNDTEVLAITDVALDWSAVAQDFTCNPLSGPITQVAVCSALSLGSDAGANAILFDELTLSDSMVCWIQDVSTDTTTLSGLDTSGQLIDAFGPQASPWLVSMKVGSRVVAAQFMTPTDEATDREVVLEGPCGTLDLDVSFGGGGDPERSVPAASQVRLDWSEVTRDLYSDHIAASSLVDVAVGHFVNQEPGIGLLGPDLGADETWWMTTETSPTADLSTLAGDTRFTGFTEGIWAVSLRPADDTRLVPSWIEFFSVE